MAKHAVRLLSRNPVAQGTLSFHLEKPAGFGFSPGQSLDLILAAPDAPADSHDIRHTFSIVSAPHENELVVATRMRDSAYKLKLGALAAGSRVMIEGPFGVMTLHPDSARAAVFIAGGIGITPFMSMLRQAAHNAIPQDLLLLYSNRRPEDTAFLAELQALEQRNPRFRLAATMTDMAKSKQTWKGETQKLDSARVRQAVQGLAAPVFYISGPPGMVDAMRTILLEAGVTEEDIRSEEFYGY